MTRMAALCTLLLALGAAFAHADADPEEELARKMKSKLAAVAKNHKAIAKWCLGRGLNRHACRHFFEVLEINPDESYSRKVLGFKKKGKEWVSVKQVPKIDKVKGDKRTKLEETMKGSMGKYMKANARAYFDLAEEAKKLKLEKQRIRLLNRCLGYDRDHAKAREGLGYSKSSGRWVLTEQHNWIYAKFKTTPDESKSNYEESLGYSMTKVNSKRVWIAGYWKTKTVTDMVVHSNAAINSFHNLFALKSYLKRVKGGNQVKLVFVRDEARYTKFIDTFCKAKSKRKSFLKRLEFCNIHAENLVLNRFFKERDAKRYRNDRTIYLTGNKLAHALCGGDAPPWIAEGISWSLTMRILGTKENFSVALADSSAAYGAKNWNDHTKWRDYMRELALIGDSPAPSSVLMTRDWNSINGEKAAYSWSMVDFLWSTRPAKFKAYCDIIGEDKKAPVDKACREAFGYGMAELDHAWKQHVRENY